MKNYILSTLLLFVCSVVLASDYYVDVDRGDNEASGTSAMCAWETLSRVNSADLKPGDRVLFKSGQVWRGTLKVQSGDTDNPIIYTSFGGDELGGNLKPRIIRSIDLTDPAVWRLVGENLWRTLPDEICVGSNSVAFAPRDWHKYWEGNGKAKLEIGESKNGRKMFRLTCLKAGTGNNQIQFTNSPFEIKAGRNCVYRFRARASVPFEAQHISNLKHRFAVHS